MPVATRPRILLIIGDVGDSVFDAMLRDQHRFGVELTTKRIDPVDFEDEEYCDDLLDAIADDDIPFSAIPNFRQWSAAVFERLLEQQDYDVHTVIFSEQAWDCLQDDNGLTDIYYGRNPDVQFPSDLIVYIARPDGHLERV